MAPSSRSAPWSDACHPSDSSLDHPPGRSRTTLPAASWGRRGPYRWRAPRMSSQAGTRLPQPETQVFDRIDNFRRSPARPRRSWALTVRREHMSVAGLGSTVEITRDAKSPILGLLGVSADDGGQLKGCFGNLGTELASFQLLRAPQGRRAPGRRSAPPWPARHPSRRWACWPGRSCAGSGRRPARNKAGRAERGRAVGICGTQPRPARSAPGSAAGTRTGPPRPCPGSRCEQHLAALALQQDQA